MIHSHAEAVTIDCMRIQIRQIEWLDEQHFRDLAYGIVAHYRRHPEDQEWIAVELTRKNVSARGPVARNRVDEILAMLEHVHDPLIGEYDEVAPVNAENAIGAARRSESLLYPSRFDRHSSQGQ